MPDSSKRGYLIDALVLFLLAAAMLWPRFHTEYSGRWESIDGAFISDARNINQHWPKSQWYPEWYGGTRTDYVYPPALRWGTAAIARWSGMSEARGYHLYTAFFYCLGIAAVYVFTRVGSGSRLWAFLAALAAATLSPTFLYHEHFARDYSHLRYMPVRLGVLILYGEGPHSSALAVLPLALAAAWRGLRDGRNAALGLAALCSALVVSNNFYGATALAMTFPFVAWAVWLAEKDARVWLRAGIAAVLAWGLTAFWLTPSYLTTTLRNMRLVSQPGNQWSQVAAAILIAGFAVWSFRWAWGRPERAWWTFLAGALSLMALNVVGNNKLGFRVIGEPERLVPELDMLALMFAASVLAVWTRRWRGKALAAVLMIAWILFVAPFVRRAWEFMPTNGVAKDRVEYKLTEWLHHNLPDERVFVQGSVRFWYNAWFPGLQVGGASDQGTLNLTVADAMYGVASVDDGALATAWLQSMGAGAVVVNDAQSEEVYHDFPYPKIFDGLLEKVFDNGKGDRIYRVPRRQPARARVVDLTAIAALPPPEAGGDFVRAYSNAIEYGPDSPVELSRLDPQRLRLKAQVAPGQGIVVQESFDPSWTAVRAGAELPVRRDPMGLILIEPGAGNGDIDLVFETPLEVRFGWGVFAASLLTLSALLVAGIRR